MKEKKKKKIKKKIFKATQGAISLMLCILIVPFLSMAASLVELSRYQSATETIKEVIDSSMLSVLAQYDEYLNDRYGLLAISQDVNISQEFSNYLTDNSKILGKAASVNSPYLVKKYTLNTNGSSGSYDVLESQLLDYSETSVLTETTLENFKLQDLIDQLNKAIGLEDSLDLDSLADRATKATKAVKTLVESAKAFRDCADNIKSEAKNINVYASNIYSTLNNVRSDLQKDLKFNFSDYSLAEDENGNIVLKKTTTDGEESEDDTIDIVSIFEKKEYKKKYGNYYKSIKDNVDSIKVSIQNIKGSISDFSSKLSDFKTALKDANDAVASFASTSEATSKDDNQQKAASTSTQSLCEVFEEIIKEFNGTLEGIGNDFISSLQKALNDTAKSFEKEFFNSFNDDVKSFDSLPRESLELMLDYFLSNKEQRSFSGFIKYFTDNSTAVQTLRNLINDIPIKLKTAADNAVKKLGDAFKEAVINTLKSLVKAIKSLFKIKGICDNNLNAYLSDEIYNKISPSSDDRSPYELFLDGIVKLIKAVDGLRPKTSWIKDPFGALQNALNSIFNVFDAIGTAIRATVKLVTDFIGKMKDFISDFGHPQNFYDFFLLAGYMIHNLPNRINYKNGSSLTGYKYSDIHKDSTGFEKYGLEGIEALANFIGGALNENGGNKTFRGAEAEYIAVGTRSEIMNQIVVFMQIYMIRLILDLPAVFTDENVANMAKVAGKFGWVVYLLVMFAEPMCDAALLVNNSSVCLIKKSCYMTIPGIPKFAKKLTDAAYNNKDLSEAIENDIKNNVSAGETKEFKEGAIDLDYEDHLLIDLALCVRKTQMLSRFADIVEIETTQFYKDKGKPFDMNKTITAVTCKATVTYHPMINIFENAGLSNFTIKYQQDRSY